MPVLRGELSAVLAHASLTFRPNSPRLRAMSTDLHQAVARTLAYAEVFGYRPSRREVWQYLATDERVTYLVLLTVPCFRKLPSTNSANQIVLAKWRAVAQAVSFFGWLPWIKGVWLTGALAAGVVKENDDLDFLIVTDSHRLWLTRFCLVAIGLLLNRYRSRWLPRRSNRDRWCCNIWLEPSALALPPERQTLYEARELMQAVPVYVRPGERATLLLEHNRWARRWSANGFNQAWQRARRARSAPAFWPVFAPAWLERILNGVLWRLQCRLMAKHRSREVVQPALAFFHPRDTRSWVQRRYETICTSQGIPAWFAAPN